jgi:hypothetical protein
MAAVTISEATAAAAVETWLRSRRASVPAIPAPVHSDDDVRSWLAEVVVPAPSGL